VRRIQEDMWKRDRSVASCWQRQCVVTNFHSENPAKAFICVFESGPDEEYPEIGERERKCMYLTVEACRELGRALLEASVSCGHTNTDG